MRVGKCLSLPQEQLRDFQALADRLTGVAPGQGNVSSIVRIAVESHFGADLERIRAERLRREKDAARKREQRQLKK